MASTTKQKDTPPARFTTPPTDLTQEWADDLRDMVDELEEKMEVLNVSSSNCGSCGLVHHEAYREKQIHDVLGGAVKRLRRAYEQAERVMQDAPERGATPSPTTGDSRRFSIREGLIYRDRQAEDPAFPYVLALHTGAFRVSDFWPVNLAGRIRPGYEASPTALECRRLEQVPRAGQLPPETVARLLDRPRG